MKNTAENDTVREDESNFNQVPKKNEPLVFKEQKFTQKFVPRLQD